MIIFKYEYNIISSPKPAQFNCITMPKKKPVYKNHRPSFLKTMRLLSDRINFSSFLAIATTIIIVSTFALFAAKIIHPADQPSASPTPPPLYQDFHLVVPALKIDTPVIADVDGADQEAYFKALENGVAHLKGSSKPSEGSNIFIFGHSSFYWYKPGEYKEIFRNLEDLQNDDEIIIRYNGQEYRYKVSSKKTVDPSQVDVIRPTTQEQVSLMTCVPPGTTLKRLIVVAVRAD